MWTGNGLMIDEKHINQRVECCTCPGQPRLFICDPPWLPSRRAMLHRYTGIRQAQEAHNVISFHPLSYSGVQHGLLAS